MIIIITTDYYSEAGTILLWQRVDRPWGPDGPPSSSYLSSFWRQCTKGKQYCLFLLWYTAVHCGILVHFNFVLIKGCQRNCILDLIKSQNVPIFKTKSTQLARTIHWSPLFAQGALLQLLQVLDIEYLESIHPSTLISSWWIQLYNARFMQE